ncbi:MAG TPA: hypothetical protein VLF89_04080 [Candidatus Saccharimonadales bacterium]|nr:hypothetical protein [Candidatus Saccharimonadales bacterium]
MPSENFKTGDVVHLNSEPRILMTVESVTNGNVKCYYWIDTKEIRWFAFHQDMLKAVKI